MVIHKLNVGPLEVCCYIVVDSASSEAIVIDPGADAEVITAFIMERRLIPRLVVITHGHGDHIGANAALKKEFPDVQICVHEEDQDMLPYPAKNLSILAAFFGGTTVRSPQADRLLKDGDIVAIKGCAFEIIHTPGHSHGGIC
ncbi:MAG: MBL fold metallo-hydrolase, partial [Planctomycetota bacterium]